jgi:3-hydroxy acid dehydrogenase / malonic semialdehyde reductase
MNRLKNQTALITGATSGIGKASAKALAKMGVNLVISGRREEKLLKLKEKLEQKYEISVCTLSLDVTKQKEVEKELGKVLKKKSICILINSAGLALGLNKIDSGSLDDWEGMIDTNIKGVLYVSRMVIAHMRKNRYGHIINIGSIAGVMSYPGGNVYCATKSAVHTLSEAMNIDLLGTNIRVSNVAPGAVETEFSKIRFHGDEKKADAVYEGYKPLRAKDVADLICYILNAPLHVNIQNTLIMPTAQRNPYVLHRDKK